MSNAIFRINHLIQLNIMRTICYCLIFLLTTSAAAQNLALEWAQPYGNAAWNLSMDIEVDSFKNVYVCGGFEGTLDMDPGPGILNINAAIGSPEYFIQKLDSAGNLLWVKQLAPQSPLIIGPFASMTLDAAGSVLFTGYFTGTVDFDPGPGVFNLTAGGSSDEDYFVLKLDASGDFLWAIKTEGNSEKTVSTSTDPSGNIYNAGKFTGTIDFDPGPNNLFDTTSTQGKIFIQKLDASGNLLWVKTYESDSTLGITSHNTDAQGNLILTGTFAGTVNFSPTLSISAVRNIWNAYSLKIDPLGEAIWANQLESSNIALSRGSNVDKEGNIYVLGTYVGVLDFDPGPNQSIQTSSDNGTWPTGFIQKLDAQGNFLWARSYTADAPSSIEFRLVRFDDKDQVYLAGPLYGEVDFDTGPAVQLAGIADTSSYFMHKMSPQGDFIWGEAINTDQNYSRIMDFGIDKADNIYLTGSYVFPFDIEPGPGSTILSPVGSAAPDFYVAKWSQDVCGDLITVIDSVQNVSCNNNGYISLHAEGGKEPYAYSWNTTPISTDSSIILTDGGIYEVSITDSLGCMETTRILVGGQGISNGQDFVANVVSTPLRPGFPACIWLDAFNNGCIPFTGEARLLIDSLATFNGASPMPDSIRGDTLIWYVNNVTSDSAHLMTKIDLMLSTQAMIGDDLCLYSEIRSSSNGVDSIVFRDTLCREIVNSYDPNDKQARPQGACDAGYVLHDEPLSYTIRFQNTGNADAINIFILDTLDLNLDLNSLKVIGQSHESLVTELIGDRTLKFRFDNIHLPDSTTNEAQSHGYVVFEVSPLPNRIDGTELKNRAGIYFDFNEPIITNTVLHTLVDVIPTLNETLTQVGGTLISNEPIVSGLSYQWVDCSNGNSLIEGATGQSFSPESNGTYAVMLDNGNCSTISACVTVMNVGIDAEFQSQIKLYPNPATASLQIDLGAYYPSTSIEVINALGQILDRRSFGLSDKVRLELPEQKGIYFINVYAEGKQALLKVLRR